VDNSHNNYVRHNKEITEGNLGASLEYVQQCMEGVIWFGLVWFYGLTPLPTIFQLYRGGQLY
jgi:hypothetical protein